MDLRDSSKKKKEFEAYEPVPLPNSFYGDHNMFDQDEHNKHVNKLIERSRQFLKQKEEQAFRKAETLRKSRMHKQQLSGLQNSAYSNDEVTS
jgi:hypothetical protein